MILKCDEEKDICTVERPGIDKTLIFPRSVQYVKPGQMTEELVFRFIIYAF